MIRASLFALAMAATASAAAAQSGSHQHHDHQAPTPPAADPHAGHAMPDEPAPAVDPHAGHRAPASADPHAGHAMASEDGRTGADLAVGRAPAPAVVADHLADQVHDPRAMARARRVLADEHGGAPASKLQADLLEWAPEGDGYRWEVEGWYGGDVNRLAFKTEGEGRADDGVEAAEVQVLYSRAVARYTNVQAGLRYDVEPRSRAYAVLAVDTMLPYWFEVEGSLFLSQKGDVLARLEGGYDLRLTQRLILQPRAELEFAAQDIPESGVGSGLSKGEFGLRLRYEIRREFAPYVGVNYERRFGDAADLARAHGETAGATTFVAGIRAWF